MKIKSLSIIASFFMVSLLITSCLNDDNNVEYSSDATIHSFSLDTIGGRGISYKFTINQIKGLIYNEDSLPVRADTIVKRILIKDISTSSGFVTIKTQDGKNDSLLNINDSIDLRKYINTLQDKQLQLKVWAPDMKTSKLYYLELRVHQHDPDSIKWSYSGEISNVITGSQRSIVFDKKIFTYTVVGSQLKLYQSPTDRMAWTSSDVNLNSIPTSIVVYKGRLYATVIENGSPVAYVSENGFHWEKASEALGNVELFLAPVADPDPVVPSTKDRLSYLKIDGEKFTFSTSADGANEDYPLYGKYKESIDKEARKLFPNFVTSYAYYKNRNESRGAMLTGNSESDFTLKDGENDVKMTVTWAYGEETVKVKKMDASGNEVAGEQESITISRWVSLPSGSSLSYCPKLDNPTVIHYNDQFYLFGDKFQNFYVSESGRDWKKTNKKFTFPKHDWAKNPGEYDPEKTPEFRGRTNYSMVMGEKGYLIFMFSKGHAATGTDTYDYNSELWRGRLNSLWFFYDPLK